jgi:hypothetical protein
MSCTLHTNKKSEPQAVHNSATISGLNTPTYCMIPEFVGGEVHKSVWNLHEEILQVIGTALSTQKQKLHNSSDIPDMRYLKNLNANSSGKKTTLYFNHRYTAFKKKNFFCCLTDQMREIFAIHMAVTSSTVVIRCVSWMRNSATY